jgi:hypothetical protein
MSKNQNRNTNTNQKENHSMSKNQNRNTNQKENHSMSKNQNRDTSANPDLVQHLPAVQTIIQDIPQDRKDSFRRSRAVTAVVLRSLRLASMQAQEAYRQVVKETDALQKDIAAFIAKLENGVKASGVADLTISVGASVIRQSCVLVSAKITLTQIKDTNKYVQTTVLKIENPQKEDGRYRSDTWDYTITAKKPTEKLLSMQLQLNALADEQRRAELKMSELKGDILKAEKLGDIVEGEEAIANMTQADWEVAESSLATFNKLLSVSGRSTMKQAKLLV